MKTISRNPATGEPIGEVPLTSREEAIAIFATAWAAQKKWVELPFAHRERALVKVQNNLVARKEEVARTISLENGKTLVDAMATEVLPAILGLDFYRREARQLCKKKAVRGGSIALYNKRSFTIREPWGVVGIISPWNYPFAIPFSEVVMALLMGNAVVLKVASDTQLVAQEIKKCFENCDLPEGLVSVVNIPGREVGPFFIEQNVDKLFFTGSVAVGKELMNLASEKLIPLVLELGGADAAIVCEDADLNLACGGVLWAGFSNAGQSCAGVQRVLVHETVYEPFAQMLAERVKSLRVGVGQDFDIDMGPMVSMRQRDEVGRQVSESIAMGARVLEGSARADRLGRADRLAGELGGTGSLAGANATYSAPFYPPTILVDCPLDAPILREEVFGPVIALLPFATEADAISIANGIGLALTASVWSRNKRRAELLAIKINAGTVMINDHLMAHGLAETPWGGFGESGFGKTHGRAGLEEMSRLKTVVHDILPARKQNIFWPPYSKKMYEGIVAIIDSLYDTSLWARLRALPKMVRIFLRYFSRK